MTQSIPAQIVEAIKSEDCRRIIRLFMENPEHITFYTPFAGETWLGYAAGIGRIKSVETLMQLGISVNTGSKKYNRLPICSAANGEHVHVVKYLLETGSDLDVSQSVCNPLFAAIIGLSSQPWLRVERPSKCVEIVQMLLEAGIDSKVRYNTKTMKDMDALAFALGYNMECALPIALWNNDGDEVAAQRDIAEASKIQG